MYVARTPYFEAKLALSFKSMKKLLFECWCVTFTKLRIYDDQVEIGNFFGLLKKTIPVNRIASVGQGITSIQIETTGGGRYNAQPYVLKSRAEAVETILNLIKNNKK